MRDNIHHDPVEDSFYFASWRRSIITVPLLLLLIVNPVYHGVMFFLLEIDLFIGNFILWMFFGEIILGAIGGLAVTTAVSPIAFLPALWHSRMWGIAKVLLFVIGVIISAFVSGIMSFASIWLLDVFATPRTTLWWAELWGVAS